MAGSVNKVILIGNLGKDPEIRTLNSGDKVANLRIATSEQWKDKATGERKEKTEWHAVVVFNENIVKVCESYLKKGSTVYIEGALQTRKYTDAQGVEKYSTEIILKPFNGTLTMLGGKPQDDEGGGGQSRRDDDRATGREQQRQQGGGGGDGFSGGGGRRGSYDLNDDIPFIRGAYHDENLQRVLRV